MKVLIVGSRAREAAFSELLKGERLYSYMETANPQIMENSTKYAVGDMRDAERIAEWGKDADVAFVNSNVALRNGVVDEMQKRGVGTVGPTKEQARIEWDKMHGIKRAKPPYEWGAARTVQELDRLVDRFREGNIPMVVKPNGLTGGTGVKVQGRHFELYAEGRSYAASNLPVVVSERLEGPEFTIKGLCGGGRMAPCPVTYDYPYRYAGDKGPGTGGMGCVTWSGLPPFLTKKDLDDCYTMMGSPYTGVVNGGFIKTERGVRFMEYNARFGDPEAVNLMCLMESDLADVIHSMADGRPKAKFMKMASCSKYAVAERYPENDSVPFKIDAGRMVENGVSRFLSQCERSGGSMRTVGSRALALCAVRGNIRDAAVDVNSAMGLVRGLDYRADIGLEW